ncbi:hypothetical protein KPL71_001255 [Citrus sinensis]|uniref:Uncharacterized protein n=1 Tax=Citrus sinensis TaxID=2711 RepID=A0ACB8NWA3_CITSI|nr:hypothetical protein KPL71_001255 [Citrus sinensis]
MSQSLSQISILDLTSSIWTSQLWRTGAIIQEEHVQKELSKEVKLKSSKPLELIHTNVCGPFKPNSLDESRAKLNEKSEKFIFIGYDNNSKRYKLYNPNNGQIVISRDLLAWRNDDALVLVGQYMHVCCSTHILNLIVVLRLGELHASVAVIQNVMKYVRSSTTRLRTFKQCAEHVNCPKGIIVLDCPTRWNSTYLMLMTALKFQATFDRMAEVDKPYEAYFAEKENNVRRVGPTGLNDLESAERIVTFLKIIFGNDSLMVEQMTKTMKDMLNEFYDAYSAFSSSSTLSMYSESGLSGSYSGTSSSQRFATAANLVDVVSGEGDDTFQVACPFLGYAKKVSVQNESKRVASEVERYLKDLIEDPSNLKLNVLLWWKVNGSRYPILEKIARDVLNVPVSTVASYSAFSTGRRIIDEYRNSLTPALVKELICTKI